MVVSNDEVGFSCYSEASRRYSRSMGRAYLSPNSHTLTPANLTSHCFEDCFLNNIIWFETKSRHPWHLLYTLRLPWKQTLLRSKSRLLATLGEQRDGVFGGISNASLLLTLSWRFPSSVLERLQSWMLYLVMKSSEELYHGLQQAWTSSVLGNHRTKKGVSRWKCTKRMDHP